jgi:hypothetical protein
MYGRQPPSGPRRALTGCSAVTLQRPRRCAAPAGRRSPGTLIGGALEAAEPQAVADHEHRAERHCGSANILIEPDDRYLCIVPASSRRTGRVMLPFDGDEVLSVILSKAMLLASDDKITDPTILCQLKRRA